jgi:hypothetical protein
LTETIKLNLSALGPNPKAVVLHYLATKDVAKTAAAMRIEVETVNRVLRGAGINKPIRLALETGVPHRLMEDKTTNQVVLDVATPAPEAVKPEPVRMDLVEKHRFEKNEKLLKDQVKDLTKRLAVAEDVRNGILGLEFEPLEPICMPQVIQTGERGRQEAVLHISDTHVGEVVNYAETMGVNEYNKDIAQKRIHRLFETATTLTTSAWPRSDGAPSKVKILLGGDLISGHGLHPELAETDAGTAFEQCKWASTYIAAGALGWALALQDHWGSDIAMELISVPGNHGRSTFGKPRAKQASLQSYDTLVADFVEAALRLYPQFSFYTPRSFDAYFDIAGWPTILTHGDRMSAGGGTGFIGPAANIVKGHKKLMLTEAQQRRPVRYVFSGHFHTRLVTPWGFSNGALIGFSEFAKAIRADAEAASQNFVVIHERHGLLREQPIIVGRPDEGSIYSPNGGLILPDRLSA